MEQTTDAGDNFITLDLAYTEDEVKDSAADAKSSRDRLNLIRNTVPLVGFIVGIPCLLVGLFLTARGNQRRTAEPVETDERKPVPTS